MPPTHPGAGRPRTLCLTCSPSHADRFAHGRAELLKVNFDPNGPGCVYVASSVWMPGIVKIGSTRSDVVRRLAVSSIPHPVIEHTWRESPPWALERRLHHQLRHLRVPGTEWFQVDPNKVQKLVEFWLTTEAS